MLICHLFFEHFCPCEINTFFDSGHGSTLIHDLTQYLASLHKTRDLIKSFLDIKILPAHGDIINDALGKVDEYLASRYNRIRRLSLYFTSTDSPGVWHPESKVLTAVYPNLPSGLKLSALINLRHSLFWLVEHPAEADSGGNGPATIELYPVNCLLPVGFRLCLPRPLSSENGSSEHQTSITGDRMHAISKEFEKAIASGQVADYIARMAKDEWEWSIEKTIENKSV
ncbi:unnamed protein product [Protopolystoma xenopodis]|uniref:LACTB2 winged helix domain-containing protein n=1 Tax=Protopolystoma xenopodis TaxID=117903 RepID=A0A448WM08_9PLAT|nr:unnamed protein product [Protopolystoma xenopodis]